MRVRWTAEGRECLRDIHIYISQYSPENARSVIRRIVRRSRQIGEFPYSGEPVKELGGLPEVRQLIERPYRIWYHITGDHIEVLAVFHGARDLWR